MLRDLDSLWMKFDHLVNIKTPTGSAFCVKATRSAKYIAKDILRMVNAVSVGDLDSDAKIVKGGMWKKVSFAEASTYEARVLKRSLSATGVPKKNKKDVLVGHVEKMFQAICSLVNNYSVLQEGLIHRDRI